MPWVYSVEDIVSWDMLLEEKRIIALRRRITRRITTETMVTTAKAPTTPPMMGPRFDFGDSLAVVIVAVSVSSGGLVMTSSPSPSSSSSPGVGISGGGVGSGTLLSDIISCFFSHVRVMTLDVPWKFGLSETNLAAGSQLVHVASSFSWIKGADWPAYWFMSKVLSS